MTRRQLRTSISPARSSRWRPARGQRQLASALALCAAWVGLAGGWMSCTTTPTSPCTPACDASTVCDERTGQCRAPAQPRYDAGDGVPGRGVRVALIEGAPWVLAIDPLRHEVFAGDPRGERPALFRLGALTTPYPVALDLAQTEEALYVVWADGQGRYVLAEHTIGEDASRWRVTPIVTSTGGEALAYVPTGDVGLAVGPTGEVLVAFRDGGTNRLRALVRPAGAEGWRVEEADAGDGGLRLDCPLALRQAAGRGLGYEPAALFTPRQDAYVAYHDADCGTLRLARRRDGVWAVDVLDQGAERDARTPDTMSSTGRHPSLALDASGALLMAYQDVSRGQLMFARLVEDQLERETADAGFTLGTFAQTRKQIVGAFTTLTIDPRGRPVLTYMNATDTELRRAIRDAGSWQVDTLREEGLVGFFAHHTRDTDGRAVIVSEQILPRAGQPLGSALVLLDEVSP